MFCKLNILPKLSYLTILIVVSSCSNKFIITQKPNGSDDQKNNTQQSEDLLSNLFVLEVKITGGTGIFRNASGDITTRVQVNRISRSALTNHAISIYLNN